MSALLLVKGERVLGRAEARTLRFKLKEDNTVGMLYLPRVLLEEDLLRDFVARAAVPYVAFRGVELRGTSVPLACASFVWGELGLYRTGDPAIHDMILVPGELEGLPGPELANAAMRWLPVARALPCPFGDDV